MRCKIFLFRHGITSDNSEGIFSGWRDVHLTKRGWRDAKIIALRLKKEKINLAFCSHLARSKETLNEVLKFHPECQKIIEDDRLIERNYGKLQGKTHLSVVEKLGIEQYDQWHRGYKNHPPQGESFEDVGKRVMDFIQYLIKLIKKEKINVAISAHNNSMRPIRKYFEKLSKEEMCSLYNDYESVYEYSIEV